MSFHPLETLGATGARMRAVLIACVLAALAIVAITCADHSHAHEEGHAHTATATLTPKTPAADALTDNRPALPHSAEVCLATAPKSRAGQETPSLRAAADAPALVTFVDPLGAAPPVAQRSRSGQHAVPSGRRTLADVCCWRI
ncbi:hypothetical protein [Streptomyces marianii]|uniref:Uncharacterized protein n=1 Tax=Streptomyces marianii TaxID=1817406 RepID=A0A5R9E2F3_9ACTN|nr:hypothetical protein [Streptomyces marianii]TLQ42193.1 hypothetical protein FEF34_02160 [Streptomyces marianii]